MMGKSKEVSLEDRIRQLDEAYVSLEAASVAYVEARQFGDITSFKRADSELLEALYLYRRAKGKLEKTVKRLEKNGRIVQSRR